MIQPLGTASVSPMLNHILSLKSQLKENPACLSGWNPGFKYTRIEISSILAHIMSKIVTMDLLLLF